MSSRGDADVKFIDERSSTFGKYLCGQEILEQFVQSGLHEVRKCRDRPWVNRPKGATCICVFSNYVDSKKEVVFFQKDAGQHVSETVCQYILKLDEKTKISKAHFYTNFSTCDSCSNHLIRLKDTFPHVEFKITFSALYLVERPSCKVNCYCRESLSSRDDNDSCEVLKHLISLASQIPLHTFDLFSWLELEKLLAAWDRQHGRDEAKLAAVEGYTLRNCEDRKMLQDCKKLEIPLKTGSSQDKSHQSLPVMNGSSRKRTSSEKDIYLGISQDKSNQSLPVTDGIKRERLSGSFEKDIYLLHGKDGEEVKKVRQIIKRSEWSVMTPEDHPLGELLSQARFNGLKKCRHVVIVLTKDYISKLDAMDELTHEMALLQSQEKKIISIICCDPAIVPDNLKIFQSVCISDPDLEMKLHKAIDPNQVAFRQKEENG